MGGESSIQVRNTTILLGDVRASLRTLSAGSVHCCVTSPPYWGLRSYGTEPQIWANGWRGELGSEPTIEQFVSNIVDVFREVKRVLRNDGTCWINIGDSYSSGGRDSHGTRIGAKQGTNRASANGDDAHRKTDHGIKPKDLCLIPWRVLMALQSDGWYVRDVIPWVKPAPMPESVTDRCTKAWEPIFMLAKSPKYFADMEAVKEAGEGYGPSVPRDGVAPQDHKALGELGGFCGGSRVAVKTEGAMRNLRNVWTITTEPLSMPHFAAYPTALPARCIKIGTSEMGVCPTCGKQWERVTSKKKLRRDRPNDLTKRNGADGTGNHCANTVAGVATETTGWQPACSCGGEPVPATVLDPFLGSGSTSVAAERLGRKSIGSELNEKYAREIAVLRIQTALDDGEHKPVRPLDGQLVLL